MSIWVGDAIQSSHLLLSPSPAFNLSQNQGLFQSVSSSQQVAKVQELKSLCGYFVAYLCALLGVYGMQFRDQLASLSVRPPLVAHV